MTLVLFGATGDLARTKLWPALHDLATSGRLPEDLAVLGQYEGYRDEDGVATGSRTDTFAALRVEIDSWRWAGVPFYLRTGKKLAAKSAEVVIVFRPAPHSPFGAAAARPSSACSSFS